jgi:hypothetical protein
MFLILKCLVIVVMPELVAGTLQVDIEPEGKGAIFLEGY